MFYLEMHLLFEHLNSHRLESEEEKSTRPTLQRFRHWHQLFGSGQCFQDGKPLKDLCHYPNGGLMWICCPHSSSVYATPL